jgi:TPR repeat protein
MAPRWSSGSALAAAKGLAEAQYRLGAMYDKGMVFRSDKIEAARWYEKASRQGHDKSGTRLAVLAASRLAAVAPASGSEPDAAKPAAAKTAATPVTAGAPGAAKRPAWRVQLASFRSADEAGVAWRRLTRRHPELLDGLKAEFVEADLGPERGIYHRLTAGPLDSGDAARALCRNIKERAPRQGCLPLSR